MRFTFAEVTFEYSAKKIPMDEQYATHTSSNPPSSCTMLRSAFFHGIRVLGLLFFGLQALVVGPLAVANTNDVILNADEIYSVPGITVTGTWTRSTLTPRYGAAFLSDGNAGKGNKSVLFTPTLPVSGVYRVYMWWKENVNYSNSVPVRVTYAGGKIHNTTVNHRKDGDRWALVGTYRFDQGAGGSLLIRNNGTTAWVMADAVRFSPVMPEVVVDDNDTAVTKVGAWSSMLAVDANVGNYSSATGAASESAALTWNAVLPVRGRYRVQIRWNTVPSPSSSVPLTITGTRNGILVSDNTIRVNQAQEGRHWISIQTYQFDPDVNGIVRGSVKISNQITGTGTISADAVRFQYVSDSETVLDDLDGAAKVAFTGTWNDAGFAGTGSTTDFEYSYSHDDDVSGLREVLFKTTPAVSGLYHVYLWWRQDETVDTGSVVPNKNSGENVPVTITHPGGIANVTVNQRSLGVGGMWRHLGSYNLTAGVQASVKVSNLNVFGYVVADAVNFALDPDGDGDGMLDSWEIQYFGNTVRNGSQDRDEDGVLDLQEYLNQTDPTDWYNGVQPTLIKLPGSDSQAAPPSTFLPAKLEIQVSMGGAPLPNAPVQFTVTQGDGLLSLEKTGTVTFQSQLPSRTDSLGNASVHFNQATDYPMTSWITVGAGSATPVAFSSVTTPVVGLWSFGESQGSSASDTSGAANHGVLESGVGRSAGYDGRGGILLGGSGKVAVTDHASLDLKAGAFTVSGWVRLGAGQPLATLSDHYGVVSKGSPAGPGLEIALRGASFNGIHASLSNGVSTVGLVPSMDQSAKFRDGLWHHVALVRSPSGSTSLYLDGAMMATQSAGISIDSSELLSFGSTLAGSRLTGELDEWEIRRDALTVAEIQARRNRDLDQDGLADWWEWEFFRTGGYDPNANPDGDAFTNAQELANGTNPFDIYNGIPPQLSKISGDNQTTEAGGIAALPFVVEVRDAATSAILVNAPVTITAPASGRIINPATGATGTTITLMTGIDGRISPKVKAPSMTMRTGDTVIFTAGGATTTFAVATNSAIANLDRWAMNENAGAVTASQKTANLGTLVNAPVWTAGVSSLGALSFNGSNQHVEISEASPATVNFGTDQNFSISVWIKMNYGAAPPGRIVSKGLVNLSRGYALSVGEMGSGRISFDVGSSDSQLRLLLETQERFDNGRWHNVTAVFDRSETKASLYVDGKKQRLVETEVGGGPRSVGALTPDGLAVNFSGVQNLDASSAETLHFGSDKVLTRRYSGILDEVQMHGAAVSDAKAIELQKEHDLDRDGLVSYEETLLQTNPNLADTDGDGFSDGLEVSLGRNPNAPPATGSTADQLINLVIFTRLE